ncbi:MAG: FkbM family methyltransferase [Crocinitomicaceae bacterium]
MSFKEQLKIFRANLLGLDPGFMSVYYRLFFKPKPHSLEAFIDEKLRDTPRVHFLQIGGNDGYAKDPIFKFVKKYPWRGIIVEPQQEVFHKRLKKTYRFEKKVILENLAIADQTGRKKLWKIAVSNSRWATGLATFNRDTLIYQIERNYVSDRLKREGKPIPETIEDYLTYEEVNCTTIHDLLLKHRFEKPDLLQIDTEGYDFEIIKTIDFQRLKPKLISFESEHLSESDRKACEALLTAQGYSLQHIDRDTVAYL